jgi:hypothetical protein
MQPGLIGTATVRLGWMLGQTAAECHNADIPGWVRGLLAALLFVTCISEPNA